MFTHGEGNHRGVGSSSERRALAILRVASIQFAIMIALPACGPRSIDPPERTGGAERPGVVVGLTDRAAIEAAVPAWAEAAADADVEDSTARALAGVPPGAEVDVFLGTWCGDSRREVARLFRALELVPEPRPFTIRFVGVERDKVAPGLSEGADLRYVPTIIVRRDGVEVGRIVERAPRPIERELLDLLRGASRGVISSRPDL